MSTSENTTPDLPAEIAELLQPLADAIRDRDQALEDERVHALKIDELQQILKDMVAKHAEYGQRVYALNQSIKRRSVMIDAGLTAAGILVDGVGTRPPLPEPTPRHLGGFSERREMKLREMATSPLDLGPEQPIEHLARAAVTTTQVLPDDAFDEVPQPTESSPVTDEATSVGTGDTKTAVTA